MQDIKTEAPSTLPLSYKPALLAAALLVLLAAALFAYRASNPAPAREPALAAAFLSPDELAKTYGLKVDLAAVTAAGGMVDLRLGIVDGDKAGALLSDPGHFPTLRAGNGTLLQPSEDFSKTGVKVETGGSIFILFPNRGNAVRPGGQLTIAFGPLQVGPVAVK